MLQRLPANTLGTASWYYGLRETSSRNGHQRGESRFSPLETPSCKVHRESLTMLQMHQYFFQQTRPLVHQAGVDLYEASAGR